MTKCIYRFDGKNVIKNGLPLEINEKNNKGFNRLLLNLGNELCLNDVVLKELVQ